MWTLLIFVLISKSTILVFGQAETPVITIPDGRLQGTTHLTVRSKITYYAYRGIPFAKKPVRDLRFSAPVKNDPWTGILDATRDKDWCTQMSLTPILGEAGPDVVGSEDCLHINVYTTNVNGRLPVMVWIYGGGYYQGTSDYDIYGPDHFLEKGVIYVAFNYRLGVFGFLSTEDKAAYGNWGLKDKVLALKWVKTNIQYFGGDSEKITIFGQSAGAASVSYLLQSHLTAGLYHGAILESGTALCPWSLTQNARRKAFNVGIHLGIAPVSSQNLIKNLRKIDYKILKIAEQNVTNQAFVTENVLAGIIFGVVTEPDHPGAVFSGKSWQQLSTGNFQRVPLIVGYNSDEMAISFAYIEQIRHYGVDVTRFAPYDLTRDWLKRLKAGFTVRRHYFGFGPVSNQTRAITRFAEVDQFERPIREHVNQASKFTKVYYYEFSYKGLLGDPTNAFSGAVHTEELKYLFVTKNVDINDRDWKTVDTLLTLWTNFAKTGNPTPTVTSESGSDLGDIIWVPNDSKTNTNNTTKYLNISDTLVMETNPLESDWNFYKGIYGKYGDPPYTTY